MSKLKAQTTAATVTPAHAVALWPELNLAASTPEPGRARYQTPAGLTPEQLAGLQAWYAALQGALDLRLEAMSAELENLKTQLKPASQ